MPDDAALNLPDDQYVLHVLAQNAMPQSQGGGVSDEQYFMQQLPAVASMNAQTQANPPSLGGQSQMPTFSSDTNRLGVPQFNAPGVLPQDVQKDFITNAQQLMDKLNPNTDENKQLQAQMQKLNYSPQKRAQDIMDGIMGTKRDDTGKVISHNWLQAILTTAGEGARAAAAAHSNLPFTPLRERVAAQAEKEYQAEALPAVRDLLYTTQERRSLQAQLTANLRGLSQNQIAAENASINQEKVKQQAVRINSLLGVNDARTQLMSAQAQAAYAHGDYLRAETLTQAAEEELTQRKVQEADQSLKYQGLQGNDRMAMMLKDMRAAGQGAQADIIERTMSRLYTAQHPETFGTVMIGETPYRVSNRSNTTVPVVPQGGGVPPQPQGQGTSQVPGNGPMAGMNTAGGMPVRNWRSPQEVYGNSPTMPITQQWPDIPPGRTPDNDALLRMPIVTKFSGQQQNQMRASVDLLEKQQDFTKILSSIPDKYFGSWSGNLNKFLLGKINLPDMGTMDSDTQSKLSALKTLSGTIGLAHIGAQGRVSKDLVKDIADDIGKWGTDKQSILASMNVISDQARKTLHGIPGSQSYVAPLVHSYGTFESIYDQEQYQNRLQDAVKQEMQRRGLK